MIAEELSAGSTGGLGLSSHGYLPVSYTVETFGAVIHNGRFFNHSRLRNNLLIHGCLVGRRYRLLIT